MKKQNLIAAIRELAAAGTENINLEKFNLTQLREILQSLKLTSKASSSQTFNR